MTPFPTSPRSVTHVVVALALVCAVAGCSHRGPPPQLTTVVFDGQSRSVSGPVSCITQQDGGLLILANGQDHDRLRVLLDRRSRLSVVKVSLHVGDWQGYSANSAEMWASQSDGHYTINGRMPPNASELAAHQFQIATQCLSETPWVPRNPGIADVGRP